MNLHTSRILKNYLQVIEPMQKYKKTLHFKMCTLPTYLRIQFENQFLKIYIVELQDLFCAFRSHQKVNFIFLRKPVQLQMQRLQNHFYFLVFLNIDQYNTYQSEISIVKEKCCLIFLCQLPQLEIKHFYMSLLQGFFNLSITDYTCSKPSFFDLHNNANIV